MSIKARGPAVGRRKKTAPLPAVTESGIALKDIYTPTDLKRQGFSYRQTAQNPPENRGRGGGKGLDKGDCTMKKEQALSEWSLPFRHALLKGVGFTRQQVQRPFIGVLNAWGEINPAAGHLDALAKQIKAGVHSAGGTPVEFSLSSLCGGMAGGGRGSSYSLAYRDVVADFVELIAQENFFDGLVFTTVCDDVVPAHLMAAARLDIPSIIVLGGYMMPKIFKGQVCDAQMVGKAYSKLKKGLISAEEFAEMSDVACGNWGACPVMGTGNTLGAIAETLGMTLPGNSSLSGADPALRRLAYQAGVQIMSLVKKQITPSRIITEKSLENAIRVFLALGGSTNAMIHIPAIAYERGFDTPLSLFDSLSRRTPFICNVEPSGKYTMKEYDEAGGLPALLRELSPLLHTDTLTVTGKTLKENIDGAEVLDRKVIHPLSAPLAQEGGVAVLYGRLAPQGAIVKTSGLAEADLKKRGPAKVFDSEQDACETLLKGGIEPGDMVVIRYVGPKGDPGMRITARFLWLLAGLKLDTVVTLVTDGRVSGTNQGGTVCHLSPEAAAGGPIALVQDGDIIMFDISAREIHLEIAPPELEKRRQKWSHPSAKFKKGLLARISTTMLPVERGAVLQRDFKLSAEKET
jgi:dihydroxy-acid dehydratase